ncbi:MAG: hypothetical protein PGN09_00790 [Sphingomonas fennica]
MAIEALLARYGLVAILIGAGLEGETAVVTGGLLAHRGLFPVWAAAAAAFAGSLAVDQALFFVGRRYRDAPRIARLRGRPAFARALGLIERHPTRLHPRLPLPLRPAHRQPAGDRRGGRAGAPLRAAERHRRGRLGAAVHRSRLCRRRHARPADPAWPSAAVADRGGGAGRRGGAVPRPPVGSGAAVCRLGGSACERGCERPFIWFTVRTVKDV